MICKNPKGYFQWFVNLLIVDICLQLDWNAIGGLRSELETIIPLLEKMQKRKVERKNQFFEVLNQVEKISNEICGSVEDSAYKMVVDETDLSLKRLEELHAQLLDYQNEKVFNFLFFIVLNNFNFCLEWKILGTMLRLTNVC